MVCLLTKFELKNIANGNVIPSYFLKLFFVFVFADDHRTVRRDQPAHDAAGLHDVEADETESLRLLQPARHRRREQVKSENCFRHRKVIYDPSFVLLIQIDFFQRDADNKYCKNSSVFYCYWNKFFQSLRNYLTELSV